jgi:hypothetical protein
MVIGKKVSPHRLVIKHRTDLLTFGKYKGKSIQFILAEEPSYILWLHEQEIVSIPEDIIIDAEEMDDECKARSFDWGLDWGQDD